jgi:hypothetical protein
VYPLETGIGIARSENEARGNAGFYRPPASYAALPLQASWCGLLAACHTVMARPAWGIRERCAVSWCEVYLARVMQTSDVLHAGCK